jgi:hypothetical protein
VPSSFCIKKENLDLRLTVVDALDKISLPGADSADPFHNLLYTIIEFESLCVAVLVGVFPALGNWNVPLT